MEVDLIHVFYVKWDLLFWIEQSPTAVREHLRRGAWLRHLQWASERVIMQSHAEISESYVCTSVFKIFHIVKRSGLDR